MILLPGYIFERVRREIEGAHPGMLHSRGRAAEESAAGGARRGGVVSAIPAVCLAPVRTSHVCCARNTRKERSGCNFPAIGVTSSSRPLHSTLPPKHSVQCRPGEYERECFLSFRFQPAAREGRSTLALPEVQLDGNGKRLEIWRAEAALPSSRCGSARRALCRVGWGFEETKGKVKMGKGVAGSRDSLPNPLQQYFDLYKSSIQTRHKEHQAMVRAE